jgi:NADH-quinone oxidoreductase subunit C
MTDKEKIIGKLNGQFPGIDLEASEYRGELTIKVPRQNIAKICLFLKDDPELSFELCEDITAVDWAKRTNRFTVIYHIFSISNKFRLRLKADVDESELNIDSVTSVWKTANWHERETFDMYGIKFNNHPDLRRMYLPEEFEYHPLRKDFPLMGIPGSLPLPSSGNTGGKK